MRAKKGFVTLCGEDHAKSIEATYQLVLQATRGDERISEFRRLWEMAKVSLPDEAVTCDIANELGCELDQKGKFGKAKVVYLAGFEGRMRVLGEEHKYTLGHSVR